MPPPIPVAPGQVRLSELFAALSLVTDLARGRPAEEAMRACLLATALARSMGLSESECTGVYFTTLLRSVGCTATSHEYAAAFGGNDVWLRGQGDMIDGAKAREGLGLVWRSSRGRGASARVRAFASGAARARRTTTDGARADCEVGARMARRFDLDETVEHALLQVFERWDGKGSPSGLAGEQIALASRFAAVAYTAIIFAEERGPAEALEVVTGRSGRMLDPAVASTLLRGGIALLDVASPADAWVATVQAEPRGTRGDPGRPPWRAATDEQIDEVARGFADAIDLKSPYLHGHSTGVSVLAERAGRAMGLSDVQVVALRRAGLLHDLGRAGVPTGTWEKPGPLSTAEWEQVRLHPYHTERILGRAPVLAPLARLAGLHHERIDGSGYHRGAPPVMQDLPARILAAADVFHALTEERPHRPAYPPAEAARIIESQALDRDAVRAVIEAGGQKPTGRSAAPAGLTPREVEVLRYLVRGRSEKQIGQALFISGSTVHTHVAHIYEKAHVSTRAGLAMFAMERDLIGHDLPSGD